MVSTTFIVFIALIGLTSVYSNINDFDCFERADPGPGRAFFELYTWNARNRTCTKFVYGGLLGNHNRFQTKEECYKACHDAVLHKQLKFHPTRRYSAVNRLHEMFQIALNIEEVDHYYFKLISQPSGKVLSVITSDKSLTIGTQDFRNDNSQLWDIIPTGEKDYFRIKTVSRPMGQMDYMFLQVTDQDITHLTLARRDYDDLSQQWRFV
ncbi:unnamed protein product [Adineta ricciae]|uniref:BPTI/Kunitz inhibitor domain-containing protein n=1 Tax=Adineta ricciae TaxID=249248 RepID=A0A815XQ73_ADIRI|nr:unnamed protein product [Adineta ricciae]CAF1560377.1 unnamed protein product [Adineta ricciae]